MVQIGSVVNPKVEVHGLVDVLGMAVAKQITERMLAPFIGNATLKSSVIKGVAGGLLYGKMGKIGNMVAGGLVVDAAEDAAVSLLGMIGQGSSSQPVNEWA